MGMINFNFTAYRKIFAAATALALIGAAPAAGITSNDHPGANPVSNQQRIDSNQELRNFLSNHGVSNVKTDALVKKFASGRPLDSMTGSAPLSTKTWIEGSQQVWLYTYPDGSVSTGRLQLPSSTTASDTMNTMGTSIRECTTTSGSGWATFKNCKVQADNGAVYISFRVDYERYVGANAKILRSYDPRVGTAIGWTATLPKRTSWVPNSFLGSKALVRYRTNASSLGSYEDFYATFYLDYKGATSVSFA